MLTDNAINVPEKTLKRKFTNVMRLRDTLLGQSLTYDVYQNKPFVKVIHNGWYHWLAITTYGYQHGTIFVLDSKFDYSLLVQTKLQICALMNCHNKFITVAVVLVQQQTGGVDCGLFAITLIQYILAEKKNPIDVSFTQSSMRNHALKCLENANLEMFPQSKDSLIKRSTWKSSYYAI